MDRDTVDRSVVNSPVRQNSVGQFKKQQPAPVEDGELNSPRLTEDVPAGLLRDSVPSAAHFVVVDTTDPPGVWTPRRPNWESAIVTRELEVSPALSRTIDDIRTVQLTPTQEAFSLTPVPLGLWAPECEDLAADSPTVAELRAEGPGPMTRWLDDAVIPDEGRVHSQSRGEAVFRAICQGTKKP